MGTKPQLANGEIYHIYNRGVEGRQIFMDNSDYFRFIHDCFEFNDTRPALNLSYRLSKRRKDGLLVKREKRTLLINILSFSALRNHFHIMAKQLIDNGISRFMHKLGTGFTNYFNAKYERKGVLFQSAYQVKLVEKENHFAHLPHYIHLNALDLIGIKWRDGQIKDVTRALEFLATYRWSSYIDYVGGKNFPSITQREMLLKYFGGTKGYMQSLLAWMKTIQKEEAEELTILKSDFTKL